MVQDIVNVSGQENGQQLSYGFHWRHSWFR